MFRPGSRSLIALQFHRLTNPRWNKLPVCGADGLISWCCEVSRRQWRQACRDYSQSFNLNYHCYGFQFSYHAARPIQASYRLNSKLP